MKRCLFLAALAAATAAANFASAAVTISSSPTDPAIGAYDQYNLVDDLAIPGGTTPGGGTYNSQSYTDNAGPPGQTFTTPGSSPGFQLNSISLKGTGDGGGGSVAGNWAIRVSSVNGSTLTPLATVTAIPGPGAATGLSDWVTFAFSGGDLVTLGANKQYAFEAYSNDGWYGIGGTLDTGYAGGTAFNSASGARSFGDATLGNLANHGYDRTFHVGLAAVPEPATGLLALCAAGSLLALRRQ